MKYRIEAESQASFPTPVREHHVQWRLAPWDGDGQRVTSCLLETEPHAEPTRHRDGFGNRLDCVAVMGAHSHLSVTLVAEVETLLHNPFDYQPVNPERELDWIADSLRQAPRLWDFILHRSAVTPPPGWLDPDLGLPPLEAGKPLIEQLLTAMERVACLFDFDPECTEPTPRLETFIESRCGSSADFAHLLITLVRGWGVPARFATG